MMRLSTSLSIPLVLATSLWMTQGCAPSAPTWYGDVQPIAQGRCAGCHYEGGIGGFSLENYASAAEWKDAIASSVSSRTMPPWSAADGPNYTYDWTLSDEQIATVVAWAEAGGPEGDQDAPGQALAPVGSSLSRIDLEVGMNEAYSPREDWDDDYRCFPLEWPGTENTHITGFNARPGNDALVHHVAAYLIPKDNLMGDSVFEQLQTWDADEEGPGYTCFGGPSGPSGDLQLPIQQLAQWVPGNQGLDFPAGTGIYVEPGSWVVMQVHYNSGAVTDDRSDLTSLEFRLDAEVDHRGAFAPWLDTLWALGDMDIPPGNPEMVYSHEGDPRGFFEMLNPALTLDDGFTIHSTMLHMHRLGASGDVHVTRADGTTVPLLSVPDWDFDWQLSYQLNEAVSFGDGDSLSLSCTFDNSAEGAVATGWGEGTDDEMCVANLYISLP